jgi:hypothetical protein
MLKFTLGASFQQKGKFWVIAKLPLSLVCMNLELRNWLAAVSADRASNVALLCALAGFLSVAVPANLLALDTATEPAVQKNSSADKQKKRKPRSSGPTLTPAAPTATPGNSIQLTSSSPVTWTLTGVGTLSNQTATSVTYTAPASVVPQNQLLGCPVLPNDSVFNTPVNNLPLDPNSNAMIAAQSLVQLAFEPSWGVSYADGSTPLRTFLSFYDSVVHPNFVFPLQGPNLKREGGDYVGLFSFTQNRPDHHVMTVRRTDCTFWESYDDYTDGYLRTCNDGVTPNCNVQSAVNYASTTYNFTNDWGTDAGGLLLAPLTWHVDEIRNGVIKHAARFTEGLGGIQFGGIRWPASATAGGCSTCPNTFPMGTRLRLKASFNISTFSPYAQVMLTALKTYGMILADTGSNNAIQVSSDFWDDPKLGAAMAEIFGDKIYISNFEVVDESSLEFSPTSYAVCPFNATCMGAANTFVQPLSQAMITATTSGGAATSVPVALQGIAIGLGVPPVLPVQAGNYSFQIPFWVNGTANQSVTWTLQSGVGSITAGGVYTPPLTTASSAATTPTVLMATSAADPNVTTFLYLNILPAGVSPVGSIRIDTGSPISTTDAVGDVWLPDTGAEGTSVAEASDYPNWVTANTQQIVYQSAMITYGADLRYTMAVPNGNYRVHLMFGHLYNSCTAPCGTWPGTYGQEIHTYNPQMLETQGVLQSHYFDWGLLAGYNVATPEDAYLPAKVTNNILKIGAVALAPDSGPNISPLGNKLNNLNGVEILPDASIPHWTIDTQQQSTIAAGQTLRPFYVTDWYTGVNDPAWTLVSGLKGATLTGSTLTLAAGAYYNKQPIVVKASDGTYSATATILTTGGAQSPLAIIPIPPPVNHYSYKRVITIHHAQVAASQVNFPVAISITDPTLESALNGGHVMNQKGYDIILTSDSAGANKLNWEVEKYDPVAGNWVGHVNIAALSSTADTVIYAFYGNPAIITDQSTPAAVWDANFTGVYHMANITSSAPTVHDSSTKAHNSTNNVLVVSSPSGEIGPSASFAGSGTIDHFELPASVLNATQGTVSAWIDSNVTAAAGQNFVTAAQADASNAFSFAFWTSYYNATIFGWVFQGSDNRIQLANSVFPITAGTWEHVVYSWSQPTNTQIVYRNGVVVNTTTTAFTPYAPISTFWVGSEPSNQSYVFGGLMDELRFSNIPRSASWITTEYNNQGAPATFLTIGSEAGN